MATSNSISTESTPDAYPKSREVRAKLNAAMRRLGIKPGVFNQSDRLCVTISDTARILGRTRKTIYARMRDGSLPLEIRTVGKRPMILVRSIEKVLAL